MYTITFWRHFLGLNRQSKEVCSLKKKGEKPDSDGIPFSRDKATKRDRKDGLLRVSQDERKEMCITTLNADACIFTLLYVLNDSILPPSY